MIKVRNKKSIKKRLAKKNGHALNQDKTPLLDILLARAKRKVISFHTPGHKNGRGIDKKLASFTGRNMYSLDVTVFPEVDLRALNKIFHFHKHSGLASQWTPAHSAITRIL